MTKAKTITVPAEVWLTAFACFAGQAGARQSEFPGGVWPESWQNVFRFACDDAALARLGISRTPEDTP